MLKELLMVFVVLGVFLTTGCSSTMTREEVVEQEIEIQEMRAEAKAERIEQKQEQMEDVISEMPDWVVEPPRADETGFYGVGSGSDNDPVISARKASLQAKYELASTLKSELSGDDTMSNGGENGQYRYVINNFVNKVNLTGYELVKRKVVPQHGEYKTFILLKLPYDKFNEVLTNQAKPEDKESLEDSYARLMKRINSKNDQNNNDAD